MVFFSCFHLSIVAIDSDSFHLDIFPHSPSWLASISIQTSEYKYKTSTGLFAAFPTAIFQTSTLLPSFLILQLLLRLLLSSHILRHDAGHFGVERQRRRHTPTVVEIQIFLYFYIGYCLHRRVYRTSCFYFSRCGKKSNKPIQNAWARFGLTHDYSLGHFPIRNSKFGVDMAWRCQSLIAYHHVQIVPVIPFALTNRVGVAQEDGTPTSHSASTPSTTYSHLPPTVQHWVSVLLAVYGASLLGAARMWLFPPTIPQNSIPSLPITR